LRNTGLEHDITSKNSSECMATIIFTTVTSVEHHHYVIYHRCSQLGQNSVIDILVTLGWAVLGSNPDGGVRFFTPETSPGAHPDVCTIGTGSFQG
jgi:hypothetical protein